MGLISKVFKLSGGLFLGGTGVTVYSYPELRQEPVQLLRAMHRGFRCFKAGSFMAYDYLYVTFPHKHIILRRRRSPPKST